MVFLIYIIQDNITISRISVHDLCYFSSTYSYYVYDLCIFLLTRPYYVNTVHGASSHFRTSGRCQPATLTGHTLYQHHMTSNASSFPGQFLIQGTGFYEYHKGNIEKFRAFSMARLEASPLRWRNNVDNDFIYGFMVMIRYRGGPVIWKRIPWEFIVML